jgi:hypothetical protein
VSASAHGVVWPGPNQFHNVRAWAELLVATRGTDPDSAHPPAFAAEITARGLRLQLVWRETLRYHKNLAYGYELEQVRGSAGWFLTHVPEL